MRLTTCLFAVASLAAALPQGTLAQDAPPPPRTVTPAPPPPPPPPREYRSPYPRAPGPRYAPRPHHHHRPRYWGWGWGWYPLYPVYPVAPPPPPSAPPHGAPGEAAPVPDRRDEDRLYTRFSLYGAGREDGYMAGLTFGLDTRFVGFNLDVSALAREHVTGDLRDDESDPATLANAHLTWTVLSDRSFRLRLETGVSMLDLPDSVIVVDQPWRGKTVVGPNLGVSGQLGMVGPLGIEGYARITPFPERIADTFLGLAVHGGPVGVSAGWRWVDVAGDGVDAPKLMFRGPQVGLVLAF